MSRARCEPRAMARTKRLRLRVALALLTVLAGLTGASGALAAETIKFFTRSGCPRCSEAREFLTELKRRRPGLSVHERDVAADLAARAELEALAAAAGVVAPGAPAFVVRGTLVLGWRDRETTGRDIEAVLVSGQRAPEVTAPVCPDTSTIACPPGGSDDTVEVPVLGLISARRLGLPLFTVVLGLIDGFNPCAMWVLMYLLGVLAGVRQRARMVAVAGGFVATSGVVYFAFMAAWLNVFRLIGFSRTIEVVLGLVALAVALLNLKDAAVFGRGPSLSIPQGAKPGLYARVRRIVHAESTRAALAGAVALAIVVNLFELLCTAGLPAIYTHVLAARGLPSWQHYAYLALYNLAYILDDGLMVTIAVVTLSRRRLQERGGRILKGVSGAIMLVLALLLLFWPAWLR
jgi:glutaredoxin